jgi:Lhr-like helicase
MSPEEAMSRHGVYGKEGGVMPQGIDVVERVKREYCRTEARRMAEERSVMAAMTVEQEEAWLAFKVYEILSKYEKHLEEMVREYQKAMHERLGVEVLAPFLAMRKEKK